LSYAFPEHFSGQMDKLGINPLRKQSTGVKSAIIREKGVNGDREMAWAMYLAGMDVKDVHMTDLISGRENLEDVKYDCFCGWFFQFRCVGISQRLGRSFSLQSQSQISPGKISMQGKTR
jgi:phosphoribosylformylglycinamidine synthase